jgi:hypothetical protein
MKRATLNRRIASLAQVFPMVLVCACASTGSGGHAPSPYTGPITRAEIENAGARNAYDVVERLRPRWLTVRAMRSFSIETEVVVFQDRLYLGTQDELRRIGTDGVYSIEYVDGPTAQATLPGIRDMHVQGAIVVHMSPPQGGGSGAGGSR